MKTKTIKTAKICRDDNGKPMTHLQKAASLYLFNHRYAGGTHNGCSLLIVRAYRWNDGRNQIKFTCNTHDFGIVTVQDGAVGHRFSTEQGDVIARFDGRILTVTRPDAWQE
jgi:hypothetical protein